jgi:hypothetical protein
MRQRHISESQIIETILIADEFKFRFPTREGRLKYTHPELGINIIIDQYTNIIVTVTESDERKNRSIRRVNMPFHYPPINLGPCDTPLVMVTLHA